MPTKFERSISFEKAHIFPMKYKNLQNLPHWHKEHELVYVESGILTAMINGNFFTLYEGMCCFLNGGELHNLQGDPNTVCIIVKLDADYFKKIVHHKHLQFPILKQDYALPDFFSKLFAELESGAEYCGLVADSMTVCKVAQIFRSEIMTTEDDSNLETEQTYKALLDLIAKDYAYITFDDAARFMHFSRPYFSKYFYRHSGMTFTRYLNTIKISYATDMVLAGNMTMTEISQSVGFNTIRNFNRVFKELTGYSPNQLPPHYTFIRNFKEYADNGFDPTLGCTEILS